MNPQTGSAADRRSRASRGNGVPQLLTGRERAPAHPGRRLWRTGPVQIVSGHVGWERVHFEGPEPGRVPGEMSAFLEWFNSPPETDGVIRAATAHLWFAAVHPFQLARGG